MFNHRQDICPETIIKETAKAQTPFRHRMHVAAVCLAVRQRGLPYGNVCRASNYMQILCK